MSTLILKRGKTGAGRVSRLFVAGVLSLSLFACSKQSAVPDCGRTVVPVSLSLTASKLVLLQGNAENSAIKFDWSENKKAGEGVVYIIEAALGGSRFADPVEITSGMQSSAEFTVKEFNYHMRKLISAGNTGRVEFRIKFNVPQNQIPVYSDAIALEVTPYQPYTEYDNAQIMRIPGNYQDWKVASAPQLISKDLPGEYDGYINFTNVYPQFLMVKGSTHWDPRVTFDYIGANKFGFGGSVFSIFGGAGTYRMKVSTNTNTWGYTKINSWGLNGSAVSDQTSFEKTMIQGADNLSWTITTNLGTGDFRFRANKENEVVFGHNPTDEMGVPSYNGESIHITKAGNYTIKLELKLAGNYAYSVQKNL